MNALEILLGRRWILKSRDRELYYRMKDEAPAIKKFLTEKLGYQMIVNPYLIKIEKMPAKPENWMGILEFNDKIEYVFFCMILMFLEEKEAMEQFVLSELTEYIQGQYQEEQIDWTVYQYRRHLIKVLKYCVNSGILDVDDGSEENFAKDGSNEVLYENTGASRYFMRNFTQDIMGYTKPEDFQKEEWIDVDEDRGIVRRQRVYRQLLMTEVKRILRKTGAMKCSMKIPGRPATLCGILRRISWDIQSRRIFRKKSGSMSMKTAELCEDSEFTASF